jgi:two-component system, OmpR family, response regulator ChvI
MADEDRASTSYSADPISSLLTSLGPEKQVKEEVQFLRSQSYCVCFIQMMNPNGASSNLNDSDNSRKYYASFINTMSTLARNFGAKIVKNITDGLIIYFPKTSNSTDYSAFRDVIECGITMLAAGDVINTKLTEEALAAVTYRISADYGKVEVAKSTTSQQEDLFGPTMNLCAKINSKAPSNGMVIGGDLYLILKSFSPSDRQNDYLFYEVKGHSIAGFTLGYPVYSVTSKYSRTYPDANVNLPTLKDIRTYKPQLKQMRSIQPSPISTSATSYSDYNIMLVDDEKDILCSFNVALTDKGYNVEAFSDSREALIRFSQASSSHFNLVVLDLRMPGINGLELYARLKSINKDVRILFVSALDAVPELLSILPELRQDDILRKPIAIEDFINAVKNTGSHIGA